MKELTERYKNLQDNCRTIIDEIIPILPSPDEFDFHLSYREVGNEIEATLPLSLDAYRKFRHALGSEWKPESSNGLHRLGKAFYANFIHTKTDIVLSVELHENKEGSTCQMVKTGTEEINVYEMKCK